MFKITVITMHLEEMDQFINTEHDIILQICMSEYVE